MKLTKQLLALLLAICVILTAMPAFAATVTVQKEGVNLPAEGLPLTVTNGGGTGNTARFVIGSLTAEQQQALGITANTPNGYYEGLEFTCTFTYKEAPTDGRPAKFSIVKAPVATSETRVNGKEVVFAVNYDDIITYSPELSVYQDAHPEITDPTQIYSQEFHLQYIFSNASVSKSDDWGVVSYDTGLFPEDTLFISPKGFSNLPSTWEVNTFGGFSDVYFKGNDPAVIQQPGPIQFIQAKESGTYNAWVMQYAYSSSYTDRKPVIEFNGEAFDFEAKPVEGVGSGTWMWAPEKNGKTLTLEAGEVVAVQLSAASGNYARPGAIALVPADANADFTAAMTDAERLKNMNTPDEYVALQAATVNGYNISLGTKATVTVNGKEVETAAHEAAIRFWDHYQIINASGLPASKAGYSVRLDGNHKLPEYPTVLDALATEAKYDEEGKMTASPLDIINGKMIATDKVVLLNGTPVQDLDLTQVKTGDVIDVVPATVDNFSPLCFQNGTNKVFVNSGGQATTDGLYLAGITDYNYKFVTDTNAAAKTTWWPTDISVKNALAGCYVNGYVTWVKDADFVSTSGDEREITIFIKDLPIECSAIQQSSGRLEIGTHFSDPGRVTIDGNDYISPYYIYPGKIDQGYFDLSHLYLTNTQSKAETKVEAISNGDGVYTLKTNKSLPITLVRVTYGDGGAIVSTDIENDILDFAGDGKVITVGDNEKIFVWEGTPLNKGTAMKPLCAPLTK